MGTRKDRRGQSLTEFALILPIILIILLGMVNVALAIRAQIQLAQVAQQAVQYLVHHPEDGYPTVNGHPTNSKLATYMNTLSSYQFDTSTTQQEVSVISSLSAIPPINEHYCVDVHDVLSTRYDHCPILQDTVTIDHRFGLLFPMIGSLSIGGLSLGSIHLGARASSIVATDPPQITCVKDYDSDDDSNGDGASCPSTPITVDDKHTIFWQPPDAARNDGVPVYTYCITRQYTDSAKTIHIQDLNRADSTGDPAPTCSMTNVHTSGSYLYIVDDKPYTSLSPAWNSMTPVRYFITALQMNLLESPPATICVPQSSPPTVCVPSS